MASASSVAGTLGRLAAPLALLLACGVLRAQTTTLARADSAFAAENRALARTLYEEVLRANPAQSRAVFRLARLEPSPERALALYRRYCELEPRDPWGLMAEGDQLGRMGRLREGLAAYDSAAALAPAERDVVVGRARLLQRVGRGAQALPSLTAWTTSHPGDAEAWDLQGREQVRAGRPRAAAVSFARADSLGGVPGTAARLHAARAAVAPALEPIVGGTLDSDGNVTRLVALRGDVMAGDGVRLGAGVRRGDIGDDTLTIASTTAFATLDARPAPGVRFTVEGGARMFEAYGGVESWTQPDVDARLRLRAPAGGPAFELRAQHLALGAAPLLVANRVARSEVRANLDLPLGPLRLRPGGRAGVIQASMPVVAVTPGTPGPPTGRPGNRVTRIEESSTRLGADAALAVPLGSAVEVSAQYHALTYDKASTAGYFAPRIAQTVESGLYFDVGGDGPVSLAADLGGGVQRVARQGEAVGRWDAAFRAWSYAAIPFAPGRALWAEFEAYDAPFAPAGVATSASWRYVGLTVGLRWAIGR